MSEEVEGRETVLGVFRCVIVGVIRRINSDPYYYNGNRTEILSYRCQDDWQTLSFDRLVRSYFKKIPNWSRCRGKAVSNVKDYSRELQKLTTLQTSGRPFSLAITTTPSVCTSSTGIRNSFIFYRDGARNIIYNSHLPTHLIILRKLYIEAVILN